MGFIASSTTVTVQAKLTDAGKKKLYESIETDSSGFITKFAIGDSDANYAAIQASSGTLESGHVPEAGEFKPSIRSYALYEGIYRPGIPVILINDEYGSDAGISRQMSIGANETTSFTFKAATEWPKDEAFSETHRAYIQNPGNISEKTLSRLFTATPLTTDTDGTAAQTGEWIFQFNGGASDQELLMTIGLASAGNYTTIPIKVIGDITNATIMYNVQLIQ